MLDNDGSYTTAHVHCHKSRHKTLTEFAQDKLFHIILNDFNIGLKTGQGYFILLLKRRKRKAKVLRTKDFLGKFSETSLAQWLWKSVLIRAELGVQRISCGMPYWFGCVSDGGGWYAYWVSGTIRLSLFLFFPSQSNNFLVVKPVS